MLGFQPRQNARDGSSTLHANFFQSHPPYHPELLQDNLHRIEHSFANSRETKAKIEDQVSQVRAAKEWLQIPPLDIHDGETITQEVVIKPEHDRSSSIPEESMEILVSTTTQILHCPAYCASKTCSYLMPCLQKRIS